jgi:3-carboxy-cis,cis-muconate cycloisomerase
MLAAMPQEHERGLGGWQAEWAALPELVVLTAGAARTIAGAVDGLRVDAARMQQNLALTRGLVLAEAVTMALAARMGKADAADAHARVEDASRRAIRDGLSLAEALALDAQVMRHMTPDEIEQRLRPEAYLGAARLFVERVLGTAHARG